MHDNDIVIILNWMTPQVTLECLESIFDNGLPRYRVCVFDNGSLDDSMQILREYQKPIELIGFDLNYGFAGGCNKASSYILNKFPDARNLLFLNSDTIVQPGALELLFDSLNSNKALGIVVPLIYYYPRSDLVWAAGTDFHKLTFAAARTYAKKRIMPHLLEPRNLEWATGCCLAVRASLFKKVNGFWEELWTSAEDIDLSFKVRQIGYDIAYIPSSVIFHKDAVSNGGTDSPLYVYYQTRNELYFRDKWLQGRIIKCLSFGRLFLSLLKRCVFFALKRNFLAIWAVIRSIRDFKFGIIGKIESL